MEKNKINDKKHMPHESSSIEEISKWNSEFKVAINYFANKI